MTYEEKAAWWEETHKRMLEALEDYCKHLVADPGDVKAVELSAWCTIQASRPAVICARCRQPVERHDTGCSGKPS